jgi:uncharacterized protein (DUF1778 family)
MTTASLDRGRITTRVSVAVQETLETAAGMVGATVNQFIVQTALREAELIIERERLIHLGAQDAMVFFKALENPLPPNEHLKAALQDYTKRRNDQTGTIGWQPRPSRV